MKKTIGAFVVSALISVAAPTLANTSAQEDLATTLSNKIANTLQISVSKVAPSPIKGVYQAYTEKGILYITEDGSKMLHGNVYDLNNGVNNLTDAAMNTVRHEQMGAIKGTTIDYKAKDEKYVVNVFTDITCGYCRKLHNSMDEYNELGITVRYLAYPRNGRNAGSWSDMEKVWCSIDQRQAMDDAKANIQVSSNESCDAAKSVDQHYRLGGTFGVTGTPAIVTESGALIPGYMPPEQLLARLKQG